MTLTGEVSGKTAILIDDMADTCGTLCTAAEVLAEHGTTQVVSVVTHGILSGDAIKKLNACTALSRVVVTNTVPLLGKNAMCDKIALIDISPTLAGKLFFFLQTSVNMVKGLIKVYRGLQTNAQRGECFLSVQQCSTRMKERHAGSIWAFGV